MAVKRRDFEKIAAQIHQFLLKLSEEVECAEVRDALNLSLLQMQRYYRSIRSRSQIENGSTPAGVGGSLSMSLRTLSPMTPFRDAPDKFVWKWIDLDTVKAGATLPANLDREVTNIPLIIRAARQSNNIQLAELIERDPSSLSDVDSLGRTALFYAVQFSHLDTVQLLLDQGAEVNALASDGSTVVHRACHNGNSDALLLLIQYNADLSIQDVYGRAPIHWSCLTKSTDCLQMLLENSADMTARDNDGMSPSMWACRMDHIEHFVKLSAAEPQLMQRSDEDEEDGFERDNSGRTWMHWSVRRMEPLECLQTLLTKDSARLCDKDGRTVIHIAAEQGSLVSAKAIVEIAGKEILELRDRQNRTPLIVATMGGHGEVVNYLLSEGADLACVDNLGATAWDYAAAKQLHYCLLIIASYIRQRAKEQSDEPQAPHDQDMIPTEEDLGINQLQIEGEIGETNTLLTSLPHPPQSKPPVTPRTPRNSHRRNGILTHRSQDEPLSLKSPPSSARRSPVAPARTSRMQAHPQKRSPSAPMDEEDDVLPYERPERDSSSGSKRMKSEHEPADRDSYSAGSNRSQSNRSQSNRSQSNRSQSNRSNHQQNSQGAYPNGHVVDDGGDDQTISIDVMDVSDFEGQADYLQSLEDNQGDQEAVHPPSTPRHLPQRPPSRQTSNLQSQRPPSSSGGSPPLASRSPTNRLDGLSQQSHVRMNPNLSNKDNYDGDWEEEDVPKRPPTDQMRDRPISASRPPLPHAGEARPSPFPPTHLIPLTHGVAGKKKKKKKISVRSEEPIAAPVPQPRSYAAPIQPPFPVSYPPPQSPRNGQPMHGRSRSEHSMQNYEPWYDQQQGGRNAYSGNQNQAYVDRQQPRTSRVPSNSQDWQSGPAYEGDFSDEEPISVGHNTRNNVQSNGGKRSSSMPNRGQKYPHDIVSQQQMNALPRDSNRMSQNQQMAPTQRISSTTSQRLKPGGSSNSQR